MKSISELLAEIEKTIEKTTAQRRTPNYIIASTPEKGREFVKERFDKLLKIEPLEPNNPGDQLLTKAINGVLFNTTPSDIKEFTDNLKNNPVESVNKLLASALVNFISLNPTESLQFLANVADEFAKKE